MNVRNLSILVPAAVLCWTAAAQADDITATEGRTYRNAIVQRSEPDGLIVTYEPAPGGFGVAKVKFRDLPDSMRSQYHYDADKANTYETQQTQATAEWHARPVADNWFTKYQQVAELNRSLAGDSHVSYMIFMDPSGKLSLQGFTGNALPYSCFLPGVPPFNLYGQGPYGGAPMGNPNPVRRPPETEH